MSMYLGVDLGATHLRAGVLHVRDGTIHASAKIETRGEQGPAAVIARIAALCHQVIDESNLPRAQIQGIGIGAPGRVDMQNGITRFLPNLPAHWLDVPLAAQLAQQTNLRVTLLNDARALTLGEYTFGAGRGADTMACFTLGTGIGGGLVIQKKLYLAMDGSAGEIGHQVVARDGLPCTCGGRGCLEAYASGPALAASGVRAVLMKHPTRLAELSQGDLNRITVATLIQAAELGDEIARAIFRQAGEYIGIAVSNVVVTIAPQKIVFGGGVARAGEWLLEAVRETLRVRVHLVPNDQTEIVTAALGDDAGWIGAAVRARDCFGEA